MFNFLKIKNQNKKNNEVKKDENPLSLDNKTKSNNPVENTIKITTNNGKISFDEFSKVEMTVGEIIEAEKVENADRLLKLKVDFKNETRQIVSGIAEYFDPADLIGKKFPFVTNLEPRKIRGEESNGMIMAVSDEVGNFSLLTIDSKISKGARLS